MKKVISMMLCFILTMSVPEAMATAQASGAGDVYSQETYDGLELEWENRDGRDILLSVENEDGRISFQYDENNHRSVKTDANGEKTFFEYDSHGELLSVESSGHLLEYEYDEEKNLIAIEIDGIVYQCVLDDSTVSRLLDESGNLVAEYQYEDNLVIGVYGVDSEGNRIDKSSDREFIGNLNQVTYNSYYYDRETGWYYCGRYYDVAGERFVDGNTLTFEQALTRANSMREVTLESHANAMYEYAMSSYDFGKPMDEIYYDEDEGTSGIWYSYQSTMSIVARVIYGENPYEGTPHSERVAVGWVIWNRKVKNWDTWGNTLESVTTYPGAFSALNGSKARMPETTSNEWASAVRVASYLFSAEYLSRTTDDLLGCMPRPTGITADHLFFRSYESFRTGIGSKTYDTPVIAGYGRISATVASLESALSAYQSMTGYNDIHINIFLVSNPS